MNLNVSLADNLVKYVKDKVESGLYASSSEVVADALRLLEERNHADVQDIQRLKDAWRDGMESGDFTPFDMDGLKAEGRARIASKGNV